MTFEVSRRFVLAGLIAGIGSGVSAQALDRSLRPKMRSRSAVNSSAPGPEAIIGGAKLNGRVTYAVADPKTGKILESLSGKSGIPPASVTKAVTALYALDMLGPTHRFRTSIIATGPVSGGTVNGDLVLMGGGDPMLDSTDLAGLAAKLKAAGIRKVTGRFLVWDGALPRVERIDPGQPDHVGYNPAISGIALNFNRVHFEWRRANKGYSVTMEGRTEKYRPAVSMAHMTVITRDLPVYTYKSTLRRDEWTVASRALGKGGSRWLPVRLPGLYSGDVFRTMARANGLALPSPQVVRKRPQGTELASHASPPLSEILKGMLKYSNNLVAEMVGLAATRARKGNATSLKDSAKQMSQWAAQSLGMTKTKLVDHSGLGDASKMAAEEMCAALVKVRKSGYRSMLKTIPMRDAKGRPVKGHPIKVNAKTGTLNFVSALAGYMTAPDGSELAFAIFAADEKKRSKIGKANREAPQGARPWNRRAKVMQQKLIERWASLYGS